VSARLLETTNSSRRYLLANMLIPVYTVTMKRHAEPERRYHKTYLSFAWIKPISSSSPLRIDKIPTRRQTVKSVTLPSNPGCWKATFVATAVSLHRFVLSQMFLRVLTMTAVFVSRKSPSFSRLENCVTAMMTCASPSSWKRRLY
jgi:hypothetical protein